MDLAPFCGQDESRPYLMQPFASGSWTYATDDRILVRIPRRDEDPAASEDNKAVKPAEEMFNDIPVDGFEPLPAVKIEVNEYEECAVCDGRGTEHECPSCQCQCLDCRGTGHPIPGLDTSVDIGGSIYCGEQILLLQALPNIVLHSPTREIKSTVLKAAFFRFDGGEGVIMPRLNEREKHIVAGSPLPTGERT